jgi:hypothetical protein
MKGVNRFDIEGHAHIDYHGNTHGVFPLTLGFLANCGWCGAENATYFKYSVILLCLKTEICTPLFGDPTHFSYHRLIGSI